jgi:hypothetical protein
VPSQWSLGRRTLLVKTGHPFALELEFAAVLLPKLGPQSEKVLMVSCRPDISPRQIAVPMASPLAGPGHPVLQELSRLPWTPKNDR